MTYQPQQEDIDWALLTLGTLAEGGIIAMPSTGSMYKVSHENKTVTLLATLDEADESHVYERSVAVFAEVGYRVQKS